MTATNNTMIESILREIQEGILKHYKQGLEKDAIKYIFFQLSLN